LEIIELVRRHGPITGERIAELLGVSRPTIRSDLALVVMLGYIDAKPKVGYFLKNYPEQVSSPAPNLNELFVKDYMGMPVVLRETSTVSDTVVALFMENVGSVMIADANGLLAGIVSRKDLLKVTLGNPAASSMPISLVMTRHPNIVTVSPDDLVVNAAQKMIAHEVDSLPVVKAVQSAPESPPKHEVVGRITKTVMTKLLLDTARGH
jgi:CBS domain-containing protein